MYNVMIDLETVGKSAGCGILSIGACFFDGDAVTLPRGADTYFYAPITPESNTEIGLVYDQSTLEWWAEQSKEAYEAAWKDPTAIHISMALARFSDYLERFRGPVICWANGASFDFPILEAAYSNAGLEYPIEYRNIRCYRTLKNLFPYVSATEIEGSVKHNAFWDAKYQAKHTEALLNWSRRFQKAEAPIWAPI